MNRDRLREMITEEVFTVISSQHAQEADPATQLTVWLGRLKAMGLWFHGAHLSVEGSTFAADHVLLYGKIYKEIEDSFDAAAEKVIGVTNDVSAADPVVVSSVMTGIMATFGSTGTRAQSIATVALKIVSEHLQFLENLHQMLIDTQMITLGLSDYISGEANTFESYKYLLSRRTSAL
jgi:hypothetical protein